MQKRQTVIAAAYITSALICTPALGQSSVTVYGVVDTFFGYGKTGDAKFTGVQSSGWTGSRLGFRGTEDLGNGLKAVFTLEYGIEIDQNAGLGAAPNLSRQQFVGLQGGFGFVGLGRQYHPGYYVFKYDAITPVPVSPQFVLAAKAGSRIVAGGAARINNAINYKSPAFGGFSINAIYGLNETNQVDDRRKGDVAGLGLDYANGPFAASLIISHETEVAGDKDKREVYLGGSYDFGAVKLAGSFQNIRNATAAEDSDKVWHIGATIPVGTAGKVSIGYGRLSADAGDSDASAWALAYSHSLSKRTTLYAGYGHIDNDDGQSVRSPAFVSAANTAASDTSHNLMLGINHAF
jgi:predicted porin